jgi:Ca2+-binding EF-hand superfamily protein
VKLAFNKLDKDGSGEITLDDMHGVFNAAKHPDVLSGKKTEDEIIMDWLDTFEQHHALEVFLFNNIILF